MVSKTHKWFVISMLVIMFVTGLWPMVIVGWLFGYAVARMFMFARTILRRKAIYRGRSVPEQKGR